MKKLRENVKISVADKRGSGPTRVKPATIIYVVRTRFIRRIHYRLAGFGPTSFNDGMVDLDEEGTAWVRGWTGPEVEALAVAAALR